MKKYFLLFILLGIFINLADLSAKKLPTPVLITPENNANNVTVYQQLIWSAVPGAYTYKLMLGNNPDCKGWVFIINGTLCERDFPYQVNIDYYWKVRAENYNGYDITDTSEWSDVFKFTTINSPLNVPIIYEPEMSYGVDINQVFKWNSTKNADEYNLQIATDTGFIFLVKDTVTSLLEYRIKLQYLTKYYYRLNAMNSEGKSPWCKTRWILTNKQFMNSPKMINPKNLAIKVPVNGTFIWDSYNGGDSFKLKLAKDYDFKSIVLDTIIKEMTLEYHGLEYGTYYHVRVQAYGPVDTSDWSERVVFRTEYDTLPDVPEKVLLISPPNNAFYTYYILSGDLYVDGYDFEWIPGTIQVDNYWFEISADSNFIDSVIDSTYTYTTSSSWSILNPYEVRDKGIGYWRVKAGNEAGWGEFSSVRQFYVNTVGVDEKPEPQNFIFPNPASDYIDIFFPNVILSEAKEPSIKVYDVMGVKITTPSDLTPGPSPRGEGSGVRVDISHLAPGIYFVRVGDVVRKFVKM